VTTATKEKAKPKTRAKAQIHMEDVVVRDSELEDLLEDRQAAKEAASDANSAAKTAEKAAQDKIAALGNKPPYRVGRFMITEAKIASRSVAFETASSTKIKIKLFEES